MSDLPEELFPPKPGGMVDTARKQARAEQDLLAAVEEGGAEHARPRYEVAVSDHAADLARARTFSVSTAVPVVQLLGRDDDRRCALIMTLDEPVVISFSQAAAEDSRNPVNDAGLSANGFVLPVNVLVPVVAKAEIFCTATSDTASRVSVMAFSYAD
jgi:hypothetical protein